MNRRSPEHPLLTWLTKQGLRRNALAARVGVSPGRITQIIDGERASPDLASKLEEVTGIDARIFLGIPIRDAAA